MDRKGRKPISKEIEEVILYRSDHTCCICRDKANDVHIHHIDGDPRNNTFDNLAVVCLNCHSKITGKRGLGRAYKPGEIKKYKQAWEDHVQKIRNSFAQNGTKSDIGLRTYEFVLKPTTRLIDTEIDVRLGEYISGEIDLSNPFHIDTSQNFPWMKEFISRYKNQGKWIGNIKYISPSGMKTYDENSNLVHYEYPDSVFKTWGAVYLQVDDKKYRIESLSIKNSLINEPPNIEMKPLLIETPGRLFIYVNPHPYVEATQGEILVGIANNL